MSRAAVDPAVPALTRPDRLQAQLKALAHRLGREFGCPVREVECHIRTARAEFATATVLDYLPILVERTVREELRAAAATAAGQQPRDSGSR